MLVSGRAGWPVPRFHAVPQPAHRTWAQGHLTEIAVFLSLMKSGFFQPGNWENTLDYLYPRAVSS